ncbi:MAG: hypothetical protein RI885_426 [Actinomycetota bacterium]
MSLPEGRFDTLSDPVSRPQPGTLSQPEGRFDTLSDPVSVGHDEEHAQRPGFAPLSGPLYQTKTGDPPLVADGRISSVPA